MLARTYGILEAWLLFTSIVMAGSAVGWSVFATQLLHISIDTITFGLIFAMAFLMYNRDRLADYQNVDDQLNMQARSQWIATHRRSLRWGVWLMLGVMLMGIIRHPLSLIPIVGGLGFAVCYSSHFLPGGKAPKQLPGMKIPYVGILWTVLALGVPMSVSLTPLTVASAAVAATLCCWAAALVNLNDIRDIAGDRLVGTKTLAVLWGEHQSRWVSLALVVLGSTTALVISTWGIALSAGYLGLLIGLYRRNHDRVYRWFIEGAGIIAGILVVCVD